MRAVTCQHGELSVEDLPDPRPAAGQVLLEVTGCGICGSDLHARHHGDAQADMLAETGYGGFARSHQQVVFGHEFSGTILEHGPDTTRKMKAGTPVVALPLISKPDGVHPIGLSASAPGAYAERVLVEEAFMMPVPNGLDPAVATLTEPMAVAAHAVNRAEISKKDTAIVIGCGPVGLSVTCTLRARGVDTIVASDPSPARRALAASCGASMVVDPAEQSPYDVLGDRGYQYSLTEVAGSGLEALRKLRRLPVPWHLVVRGLDRVGATAPRRPIIFECVGVPGIIDGIVAAAPLGARVVVAGVCMEPDRFRPAVAINKQVDLRFVVGYGPVEFRSTLHQLASGEVDASPMITGTVGLEGVSSAFDALANPDRHAKIIVDPGSAATS